MTGEDIGARVTRIENELTELKEQLAQFGKQLEEVGKKPERGKRGGRRGQVMTDELQAAVQAVLGDPGEQGGGVTGRKTRNYADCVKTRELIKLGVNRNTVCKLLGIPYSMARSYIDAPPEEVNALKASALAMVHALALDKASQAASSSTD